MKILITGANGQVGAELIRAAGSLGNDVVGRDKGELDITVCAKVREEIDKYRPDVVVNAAAYTKVDDAETERETAFAVNRNGPGNLATVCNEYCIPLIHISTDYVFDGAKTGEYTESDTINPLNIYGQSKWEGEEAVRAIMAQHIILRVSWVFGVYGTNFIKSMLRLGKERDELRVVDDQWGCPTSAPDIAGVLLKLANKISGRDGIEWGTYHYCGAPVTTWYKFAQTIFKYSAEIFPGKVPRVTPIGTTEYRTIAERPMNTAMNCSKIESAFGLIQRPWSIGLSEMLQAILVEGLHNNNS